MSGSLSLEAPDVVHHTETRLWVPEWVSFVSRAGAGVRQLNVNDVRGQLTSLDARPDA